MLLLVFCSLDTFSQNIEQTAVGISYRYMDRNVLQASVEQVIKNPNNGYYVLGASVMYTSVNDDSKFLPEIHSFYSHDWGLAGLSLNTYAIEPRIGISILNAMYLTTGYAFPIEKNKYFNGIIFGFQFNMGVTKKTKFYNNFKYL